MSNPFVFSAFGSLDKLHDQGFFSLFKVFELHLPMAAASLNIVNHSVDIFLQRVPMCPRLLSDVYFSATCAENFAYPGLGHLILGRSQKSFVLAVPAINNGIQTMLPQFVRLQSYSPSGLFIRRQRGERFPLKRPFWFTD